MSKKQYQLWLGQAVALAAAAMASPVWATTVNSTAYGDDLGGGFVTVHWSAIIGGVALETSSSDWTIVADPSTHTGRASNENFEFVVTGDTITADWRLINLTTPSPDPLTNYYISKIEIDIRPSRGGIELSLFDDDSTPSTPYSGPGQSGISYNLASTAPMHSSAFESLPWSDPANLGDMYGKETIVWGSAGMVGPGQVFLWNDDTDVVPEPGSLLLLAAGGAWIFARKRKVG